MADVGFRPGDRVVELDGRRITTLDDFADMLARLDGQEVWPIAVVRRGQRIEADIRLF